ncbi:hypothetical protein [Photobacterium galatheae]|uniref:PPM-type phosphatase domain-containing protein n=1 Tax=Photobacterium galatheae TaxID=1654360 RepID=A0A066RK76_9GAMM|nr:hypothetical protein [Photobacterium galatheae]KDM90845.1 hypothetical protein EA58_13880 [Photobacterium galatheae]MCM0149187.1 hypothetical protein [Photobacterium galatheae]
MEELKISARRSVARHKRRKANENDYDCIFERDSQTGIYVGFINSDFNINTPKPIIYKHLAGFNPDNAEQSLRDILKNIDSEMVTRGYISRCILLVYKTSESILVAKVGGGLFVYGISPPLVEGLPPAVYPVANRRWAAERDFFCGSGGAIPLIEAVDTDSAIVVMTNTMKIDIESGFQEDIEDILINNLSKHVTPEAAQNFMNDIFEFIYKNNNVGNVDAYLTIIVNI